MFPKTIRSETWRVVREGLLDNLIGHLRKIWHTHKDDDGNAGHPLTSAVIADTLELQVHTQVRIVCTVLSR